MARKDSSTTIESRELERQNRYTELLENRISQLEGFISNIARLSETGKKAGGGEKIPITGDAKAGDKDDSGNSKARNEALGSKYGDQQLCKTKARDQNTARKITKRSLRGIVAFSESVIAQVAPIKAK